MVKFLGNLSTAFWRYVVPVVGFQSAQFITFVTAYWHDIPCGPSKTGATLY